MATLEIQVLGLSTEMVVDLLRGEPLFLDGKDDDRKIIIVCDMAQEKIREALEETYGEGTMIVTTNEPPGVKH